MALKLLSLILLITGAFCLRSAEPKTAKVLLEQARRATARIQTLQANVTGKVSANRFSGTLALARPNLARIAVKGRAGFEGFSMVSNGADSWTYFPAKKQYIRLTPGERGRNLRGLMIPQVEQFFLPERIALSAAAVSPRYLGRERWADSEYDVIAVASMTHSATLVKYYISPTDGLIHVIARILDHGGRQTTSWTSLNDIRVNVRVPASTFRWEAPPGANLFEPRQDCCSVEQKKAGAFRK